MAVSAVAPLVVVATLPYLSNIVKEVTCSSPEFAVESLVAPGTDPHSFAPTASHSKAIAQAQFVLAVHPTLETWLKVSRTPIIYTIRAPELDPLEGGCGRWHPPHHHHGHHHSHLDAHVWHSPSLTAQVSKNIAQVLMEKRTQSKTHIEGCLNTWLKRIDATTLELKNALASVPTPQRVAITYHNAFSYFGKSFGFEFVPALGGSTHGQPTAQDIKKLRETIAKKGAQVAYPDVGHPSHRLQALVGPGVRMGPPLYADNLTPPGGEAATVLDLWRANAGALVKGAQLGHGESQKQTTTSQSE